MYIFVIVAYNIESHLKANFLHQSLHIGTADANYRTMVLILDGNSYYDAHVLSETGLVQF